MGTIKADTLTGLSTASDVTIASNKFVGTASGTMTVVGEGGTAQTNLQQGLSKVWSVFDGTAGSIAYADSLNTSGLTDNGTGDYTIAISNDMASGNYAVASMGERLGSYEEVNINRHYSHAFAAGSFRLLANQGTGVTNLYWVQTIAHGDLA
tara:strand:- start:385 stop:840 length:456 start_codon:yes stop_codon:yes gene_type:complete